MNRSKHIDDRTEELTIQNLIKATNEGKCMWIKVNYENFIQYQHMVHLNGTKILHVRVYLYNTNSVNLNVYIALKEGRHFIHILTSQSMKLIDLIKAIEDNKGFNEHVY